MNWDSNGLARAFDWLGETFERFNPAAFRFLAATLPYATPFPVAWITMASTETFLNFTPTISFIFVYGLEGIGLWFTSLFVDAVIDWIKSRNSKTSILVLLFGAVVAVYVTILVSLNVTLHTGTTGASDAAMRRVITLLCFLPLLTGVGNGYYKWKLDTQKAEAKTKADEKAWNEKLHDEQVRTAEADKDRARQDKLQRRLIKAGMNPLVQLQQTAPGVPDLKQDPPAPRNGDWRLLNPSQRRRVKSELSISQIMDEFGVSRATAYNWRDDSKYNV